MENIKGEKKNWNNKCDILPTEDYCFAFVISLCLLEISAALFLRKNLVQQLQCVDSFKKFNTFFFKNSKKFLTLNATTFYRCIQNKMLTSLAA